MPNEKRNDSDSVMRIVAKRGRFPAKTKKRLRRLADELKRQVRLEEEMAESRRYAPLYQAALKIQEACDWYYHDGVPALDAISVAYEAIAWILRQPWLLNKNHEWCDDERLDVYCQIENEPERHKRKDYENSLVIERHSIRAHDAAGSNLLYLLANTIGLWVDGYYGDKLTINLLYDYANIILSLWSGRRTQLTYLAEKDRGKKFT